MSEDVNPIPLVVRRAFLSKFGGIPRPVQEHVFAAFCADRDGLVVAGTGSGKTEAALMPIAQRMLSHPAGSLRALILSPTRALAGDLHRRMAPIFSELGLRMDVATSDRRTVGRTPTDILIRTPEGLDSDLCRRPESLRAVQDVVVDEIHKFLDDPRGTQLAGLLARLSLLAPNHRRIAISATVPNPTRVIQARLLRKPIIVEGDSQSQSCDVLYHDWMGQHNEPAAERMINALSELGVRKAIGFVSRRARAEEMTLLLSRGHLRGKVFAHHGMLSPSRRREVQEQFRKLPVALVIATTTLEVGIDIGSIDTCILFDAPPNRNAFLQRIGRAGRRTGHRKIICIAGLYDRRVEFARRLSISGLLEPAYEPFLAAIIQQTMSFIVQGQGQGIQAVSGLYAEAFGLEPSLANRVLKVLTDAGLVDELDGSVHPTPTAETLLQSRKLHVTFANASGTPVIDEVNRKQIGRAAIDGTTGVILGGKSRRIKGIDPSTGAAITIPDGVDAQANFGRPGISIFEALARKYSPSWGGRVRV